MPSLVASASSRSHRTPSQRDPDLGRNASAVEVRRDGAGDVIDSQGSHRQDDEESSQDPTQVASSSRRRNGSNMTDAQARRQRRRVEAASMDPGLQPLDGDSIAMIRPSMRQWDESGNVVGKVQTMMKETAVVVGEYFKGAGTVNENDDRSVRLPDQTADWLYAPPP